MPVQTSPLPCLTDEAPVATPDLFVSVDDAGPCSYCGTEDDDREHCDECGGDWCPACGWAHFDHCANTRASYLDD
jgi:hypothetical protein